VEGWRGMNGNMSRIDGAMDGQDFDPTQGENEKGGLFVPPALTAGMMVAAP